MARYIFITGGVVSSLGKGLASAALGSLLQARGYKVRLRKLDPYLNVDPGTMSPTQHGEVYVTDDGAETDLDLGHYERFTDVDAKKSDNVTTGQIYSKLISKERKGDYLGGTVQVIPHVTDLIKDFVKKDTSREDFILCEIGGTVGDIEGLPFFEAIRQLGYELGSERACFIHLTYLPYIKVAGELKTKPTQHSVKELRSIGIQPDILMCRSEEPIPMKERKKIGLFCNIKEPYVIPALDADSIYQVPLQYHEAGLDQRVLEHFNIAKDGNEIDLKGWADLAERQLNPEREIIVALVGKYTSLPDAYKSIAESLDHAGMSHRVKVKLRWVNSRILTEEDVAKKLKSAHAILVPGGFGANGADGKLIAIKYARENKIPFLGICFGMQLAVTEFARNVMGDKSATSSEFNDHKNPLVGLLTQWDKDGTHQTRSKDGNLGGTMRLGAYPSLLEAGSLARKAYGKAKISERHRHRYEVNIGYRDKLEKAGMHFSGLSPDGLLPEIIEIKDHPWFLAVQFHPEFTSRPFKPSPLFLSYVDAAITRATEC